jgi:hypothetical protein
MHYSDELCMDELRRNTDPNVILYIALMKGITPIVTIGDHKSFVADLSPPKKDKSCGHGMILHGKEHGEGYCMEGNGEWCDCKEEGLSYDEEMEALKRA